MNRYFQSIYPWIDMYKPSITAPFSSNEQRCLSGNAASCSTHGKTLGLHQNQSYNSTVARNPDPVQFPHEQPYTAYWEDDDQLTPFTALKDDLAHTSTGNSDKLKTHTSIVDTLKAHSVFGIWHLILTFVIGIIIFFFIITQVVK